jgi:HD-like signal output (HDOD) protein
MKAGGFEDSIKIIWEESVGSALIAQMISKSLMKDQESSFLAGLLASIGKAVIVQIVAKLERNEMILARNAAFSKKQKFDEKTFKLPGLREEILPLAFKDYQAMVGTAVAARWNLPEAIASVIKHCEEPEKAPENSKVLCRIVNLAKAVCRHSGFGGISEEQDLVNHPSAKALEMSAEEIQETASEAQEKVGSQLAVFLG